MGDNKRDNVNADRADDARSGAPTEDSGSSSSRRRFAIAGLATPIAMSLISRPVLAQRACSASVMASANGSAQMQVDLASCGACSSGYWDHPNACWDGTGFSRSQNFADVFGYDFYFASSGDFEQGEVEVLALSLGDMVSSGGTSNLRQCCRAATTCLLNAAHPFVQLPLTSEDVVKMMTDCLARDGSYRYPEEYLTLKDTFEIHFNEETNEGCPLPDNGECPDGNIRGLFVS